MLCRPWFSCRCASRCFAVPGLVVVADALPPLLRSFWQILYRLCFGRSGRYFAALSSGGCFAAVPALFGGYLRWMFCRCGVVASGGCLATFLLICDLSQ